MKASPSLQDQPSSAESHADQADGSQERAQRETPIPLWIVGPRRPADRERRKNAGALSRHEQARTGATPASCLHGPRGIVDSSHGPVVVARSVTKPVLSRN